MKPFRDRLIDALVAADLTEDERAQPEMPRRDPGRLVGEDHPPPERDLSEDEEAEGPGDDGPGEAGPRDGRWVVNQWLKQAVLLSFRLEDNGVIRDGYTNYFDKVPAKFADFGSAEFKAGGFLFQK